MSVQHVYAERVSILVNSDQFQILRSYTLLL